jgi:glycosyltransferase involved in cell wall biosynthesis
VKVGLVTSYPPLGTKFAFGERAISWYTANLLSALPMGDLDYEVYANKLPGQPSFCRISEHITVVRCWTPGVLSIFQVAGQIARSRPNLIHVQHEIFQFGKGISAIVTPLLFLVSRAMGIPAIVTLHSVPPLSKMDRSFIRKYGMRVPSYLVKAAFWSVIWPIVMLADRTVVHREDFTQVLAKEYHLSRHIQKMAVIPLGIEAGDNRIDCRTAKIRLGLHDKQVLLFFGYLTGYKGLELLIDSMEPLERTHRDLALIIAGDDTPGLRAVGRQSYLEYLEQRAQAVSPNIHFTGFVEENDVALYFAAADLVVLPYILGLSSSASLATAIAYERPFIASTALASVVGLDAAIFEPTVQSLVEKVDRFLSDDGLRREIMDHELKLKTAWLWPRVGERTGQLYREYENTRG